jgi:hypothetical protein
MSRRVVGGLVPERGSDNSLLDDEMGERFATEHPEDQRRGGRPPWVYGGRVLDLSAKSAMSWYRSHLRARVTSANGAATTATT